MLQQLRPALVSVLAFTFITGFLFPACIWAIGQVAFSRQANGSLVRSAGGAVVDSDLIGQNFARPDYFHPRPSAAGSGYDATASSGTNLGPTSDKLINGIHQKTADGKDDPGNYDGIKDLARAYRKENGLTDATLLPADAVTRSASGLDPDISPENAALQIGRVAKARGVSQSVIQKLVDENTQGRTLGVLGEARVNVLLLNRALDEAAPVAAGSAK